MKMRGRTQRWIVVLVLASLIFTVAAACAGDESPSGSSENAMVADGKTILENTCTQCHDLERTTSASKTREAWLQTVDRMIEKGASLSAEEKDVLVDYLAENYGP